MVNCLIFVNHKKSNVTLNHIIETGTHQPIYTPPYRRSPKDHQTITDETGKFSQQIIIEPSTSPWCSPVVLVRQKDGSTRFCVNYRKLNDISVKDSFPLPRIEDIFDQLSQPNYFTTLDFKNGYFQIPLTPHDLTKTAFSTRDNHYQFTVFPQESDHKPLEALTQKSQINGKCERWRLKLQSYNFTIKHIKGTSNTMPDYLSRSPVDHAEDEIDDEVRSTSVTTTIANDTSDKNSLPVSSAVGMVTTRSRARLLSLLISKILLHQTITILISSLTQLTHPRPT
ncbi:unnamed protein product [Rotaria socialis]|uniref:Reverse transcriptase domain-containing protein n=1 Tax=Rotaria socialis TaxID=392032 RepID=A0A818XK50_9BILA|nr:unnamed protein product [Rotaria socialis]